MTHVVVLSAPPALLPEYASMVDPVEELRSAGKRALAHLVERHRGPIRLLTDPVPPGNAGRGITEPVGARVVRHLLDELGCSAPVGAEYADAGAWIVVANGSARRGEKAPGHLDERSFAFDAAVQEALSVGDSAALAGLDVDLGRELVAEGVGGLVEVGRRAGVPERVLPWFSSDERGVMWWAVSWV